MLVESQKTKYIMKYSQNNEEEIILSYFKDKTGTFISIGENDGITFSNVRALAERGWKGVMVEPSPIAFQKLKDNYRNMEGFYFYNFALGMTNDEIDFWDMGDHLGKGDHGLLSTASEEEKQRWPGQKYEKIKVQCFRWKTFLNRLSIKTFDVISIDIEGLEIPVLKQIDLRDTSLVCVEFNGDKEKKAELDRLMIGFTVMYVSPENLIYVR